MSKDKLLTSSNKNLDNDKLSSARKNENIKSHIENHSKLNMEEAKIYDQSILEKTIIVLPDSPKSVIDGSNILKRIINLIFQTGISCLDFISGREMLPLASLISHGGSRITIAVPKNLGKKLFNALTADIIFTERTTSTHDIIYNHKSGDFKEIRSTKIGIINSLPIVHKNFAMNLNIGGWRNTDIHDNLIGNEKGANGKNGHLLFIRTSVKDKDFLMIGIENSSPGIDGVYGVHGLGTPNVLSAFGGFKLDKLDQTHKNNGTYLIPLKDSIQIDLSQDELNNLICNIDEKQFSEKLFAKSTKARGIKLLGHFIKINLSKRFDKFEHNELIDNLVNRYKSSSVKFDVPNLNEKISHMFDQRRIIYTASKEQIDNIFTQLLNIFSIYPKATNLVNDKNEPCDLLECEKNDKRQISINEPNFVESLKLNLQYIPKRKTTFSETVQRTKSSKGFIKL